MANANRTLILSLPDTGEEALADVLGGIGSKWRGAHFPQPVTRFNAYADYAWVFVTIWDPLRTAVSFNSMRDRTYLGGDAPRMLETCLRSMYEWHLWADDRALQNVSYVCMDRGRWPQMGPPESDYDMSVALKAIETQNLNTLERELGPYLAVLRDNAAIPAWMEALGGYDLWWL